MKKSLILLVIALVSVSFVFAQSISLDEMLMGENTFEADRDLVKEFFKGVSLPKVHSEEKKETPIFFSGEAFLNGSFSLKSPEPPTLKEAGISEKRLFEQEEFFSLGTVFSGKTKKLTSVTQVILGDSEKKENFSGEEVKKAKAFLSEYFEGNFFEEDSKEEMGPYRYKVQDTSAVFLKGKKFFLPSFKSSLSSNVNSEEKNLDDSKIFSLQNSRIVVTRDDEGEIFYELELFPENK